MRQGSRYLVGVLAMGHAVGCGDPRERLEKPTPPDMSDLVAVYQSPSGRFEPATAEAMLADFERLAAELEKTGLDTAVLAPLGAALDETLSAAQTPSETDGARPRPDLDADGTLSLRRICAGWGAEPRPDQANGALSLRVNFSEAGLDPVIWGDASSCKYLVGGASRLLLASGSGRVGDVRLWIGRSATFANFMTQVIVMDVDLTVEIDGVRAALRADFQWDPARRSPSFAVESTGGKVIVSRGSTGALRVSAKNGTFDCELATLRCTADTGDSSSF
ncbi:MAG: hypothetical protein OZ921_01080 [Sorangiineae bacterium]|nr:hypothetical protein [Polyangiaceae bacterium]MEB2321077.1 hypothetical protein [Sorangiineae bacterium]